MYCDDTGGGELASLNILPTSGNYLLAMLRSQADQNPRIVAPQSNEIYVFEIVAEIATVSQIRDEL